MSPVETQKIIWNKGVNEVTIEDLERNSSKFDFICDGDMHMIHVCLKETKNADN